MSYTESPCTNARQELKIETGDRKKEQICTTATHNLKEKESTLGEVGGYLRVFKKRFTICNVQWLTATLNKEDDVATLNSM